MAAPCLVALTAKSILVFNFSGRVVTNYNRSLLDDIVDIAVRGAQSGRLVVVRGQRLIIIESFLQLNFFRTGEMD